MYKYPMPSNETYFNPITTKSISHSMGNSLFTYLKMKIHTSIDFKSIKKIKIIGKFVGLTEYQAMKKKANYLTICAPQLI